MTQLRYNVYLKVAAIVIIGLLLLGRPSAK
jgi:hypothetical protein